MFYTVKLTHYLAVCFSPTWCMGKKYPKHLIFFFINTWNNIDQLQQSGYCIRMSDVGIWVARIQRQILLEGHKFISYMCVCVCVSARGVRLVRLWVCSPASRWFKSLDRHLPPENLFPRFTHACVGKLLRTECIVTTILVGVC